MLSARVLRMLVAAASIAVGLCCFSLTGCGSETSGTETAGGSTTGTADATAEFVNMPKNDLATTSPKANELAPQGIWISDYKQALAQAEKEGKDILMNFTGSDWCGYCIELREKVFRFKEFSDFATKNFVLLELDFPNDKSGISRETFMQNMELRNRFSLPGFPVILLVDARGRPYARTGFAPVGVREYVALLKELADVRVKRDEAFDAAAKLTGIEKAKKLDEALKTMSSEWMFISYADVVDEIVSLDADNQAGLRKEYDDQLQISKVRKKLKEVQELIQTTGNINGALKKIDEIETEFADFAPAHAVAGQFRLELLQIDGRNDEVVKLADTLLADKKTTGDARLPVLAAKLNALAQSDKLAAALEVADRMRQEFTEDKQMATRILVARADLLAKLKRGDEARVALQEARELGGDQMTEFIDKAEQDIFAPAEK